MLISMASPYPVLEFGVLESGEVYGRYAALKVCYTWLLSPAAGKQSRGSIFRMVAPPLSCCFVTKYGALVKSKSVYYQLSTKMVLIHIKAFQ